MTGPRCENDMRHRFTIRPGSDSHGSRRVPAEAAIFYASAARPCVAGRAAEGGDGSIHVKWMPVLAA